MRAEVRPTHPVSEVQIFLLLRRVKGRIRFSDVRIGNLPVAIREFRVYPAGPSCEVRASLSDSVPWRVRAEQDGREIWGREGESARIAEKFEAPGTGPVAVTLTARRNSAEAHTTVRADPGGRAAPYDWWVARAVERVFQDDLPPAKPVRKVFLEMARAERESFQVCLRPLQAPIRRAQVEVSDLVSGPNRIPAPAVEWFRVGYIRIEQPFAHPYAARRTDAWWPDPLLPPAPVSVDADTVQPLWFTVHTDPKAAPGLYRGRVTLRAEGMEPAHVPVSVKVHPVSIPVQGYMKTAFALMDGHLEKVYGSVSRPLRRAYTDYLLAHRLNPDDISRTRLPDLDEMEYAGSQGLNAFNLLNIVPEPERPVTWVCFAPLDAYTPQFKERFFQRLDAVVPELERRGLLDKAYLYGFDERGPEYIPVMRDLFGEIKRRYPRVHTLSTCWPPQGTDPFALHIDWYVPLISSYDPRLAETVRSKGGEMWWYVCMGPNYPYANWLMENPLIEARLIWWQAFSYDVEGFLYWGLNIWERERNDRPIPDRAGPRLDWSLTTSGYPTLNGDGVLLYPGENGPFGSLRMEAIRDGLEDTELLREYRAQLGAGASRKVIEKVSLNRTRYSRDPKILLDARLKVLRKLGRNAVKPKPEKPGAT
ncbi:MAG: DUF4091 domain-containing protein [Armatimonadetes bacterium]|nr:DUF4091 domain-containing protein [Armatimonadota bacterium]